MIAAAPSADPYRDLDVIDSHAPRVNQTVVGVLALLAVVTGWWAILGLLAAQLAIGLVFGRRYCLPCLLYFELIQPRLGEGPVEDSRPPRFANLVGAIALGVATLAHLLGLHAFAVVLTSGRGRVVTYQKSGTDLGLTRPATATGVHVAASGGDVMWMYRAVDAWLPDARLQLDHEAVDPRRYWGGADWIEAVAYPTDVHQMLALSRRASPVVRCRWCGAQGPPVDRMCQFCGVALSPPSLLGAAS
jgi:hypothetical protein